MLNALVPAVNKPSPTPQCRTPPEQAERPQRRVQTKFPAPELVLTGRHLPSPLLIRMSSQHQRSVIATALVFARNLSRKHIASYRRLPRYALTSSKQPV